MVAEACFDVVAAGDGSVPVFVLPSVSQIGEGLPLLLSDPVSCSIYDARYSIEACCLHADKAKVYLVI